MTLYQIYHIADVMPPVGWGSKQMVIDEPNLTGESYSS